MEIGPGIQTLVDTCAGVRKGERDLIVTGTGMDQGMGPPEAVRAFLERRKPRFVGA
jgi:hypothetical protein